MNETPVSAQAASAEDPRARVLAAAERCFVRSGIHGARMAQIAEEARMSAGHIYHYFESKEQIIAEMVRAHAAEKQCSFGRLEEAGDRVVDLMIERLEESVDRGPDPFWSALMLEMTAEATRNPEIAALLRTNDGEIKACVKACLGDRVNQEDLDSRLEVFVALLQGIGIRNILNPELDKAAVVRLIRGIVEPLFRRTEGDDGARR